MSISHPPKSIKDLSNLEGLHFLPLGGCKEIGMNANFYHSHGQWLMVDNGITFSRTPDAILMTDIRSFVNSIDIKTLQGLVITHAHEDHLGAAAYLWPYLRCKMYATPFTAFILKKKLKDVGLESKAEVIEIDLGGSINLGVFSVRFVSLTHSIPEPNALVIKTPEGTIFHTGDWKNDPDPLIGQPINGEQMKAIGDEGVLAVVCDSTNIFEEGTSGSEKTVQKSLEKAVQQCKGRVILSCFSSNLARVQSAYQAALANGRKVCLMGRSLERIVAAARHCGYFNEEIQFISAGEANELPPSRVMIITTGSQAEPSAALTRMSLRTHPFIKLHKDDTIIFSSRVIPGNQESISALQNRLVLDNITILNDKDKDLHVSGHPCQDELRQMYEWLRPSLAVPVHGEDMHIREHALFAQKLGIPAIRPHNGCLFRLAPGPVELVGNVPTGMLALDGKRITEEQGPVMTQRRRLLSGGILVINVILSRSTQKIVQKHITNYGVFETSNDFKEWEGLISKELASAFCQENLERTPSPSSKRRNPSILSELSHMAEKQISTLFKNRWAIFPIIKVVTLWVS